MAFKENNRISRELRSIDRPPQSPSDIQMVPSARWLYLIRKCPFGDIWVCIQWLHKSFTECSDKQEGWKKSLSEQVGPSGGERPCSPPYVSRASNSAVNFSPGPATNRLGYKKRAKHLGQWCFSPVPNQLSNWLRTNCLRANLSYRHFNLIGPNVSAPPKQDQSHRLIIKKWIASYWITGLQLTCCLGWQRHRWPKSHRKLAS